MQPGEQYKNAISVLKKSIQIQGANYDNLHGILEMCTGLVKDCPTEVNYCLKWTAYIKNISQTLHIQTTQEEYGKLYWEAMLFETPYSFESFLYYMEKDREPTKRFYEPRRDTLKTVVDDLQALEDNTYKFYGLSMPSRVGKAIAFDTPVLTKNGWKKHGELTILDEVIGLDGEFKKILAIHNPCEMEYKITFSDGEEIKCHGNHEWRVFDRHTRTYVDKETKKIFEAYKEKDGSCKYYIPNKEIVCGFHKPLWVSPYALGAWLGNGRNGNPDICGIETDFEIVQKIIDDGYELAGYTKHKTTGVRYYGFKNLRDDLQHYGMCYINKRTPKHIPDDYFTADVYQRLELLAGLLDTEGSLKKEEHRYSFTTNEQTLRDDFVSLINTFGWRTCIVRYESGISSSGIYANKPYWVVSFNPTIYIPCQIERKKLNDFSKQRMVSIEKIEKLSDCVMGNCITVEDEIYCVGRTLKPTHNSTVCIFFLAWIAAKRPNSHNAMGGHSGILAKGFYKELMNLIGTEEYTFAEIFDYMHPGHTLIRDKSAEEYTITLDAPDRFATITCRGIDGTWTGAVDVSGDGYLYVDDLVRDREHSLSPTRMENTFQEYLNKMVDRKNDGARELMVGTLWNVFDPLERIRKQYEGNPLYRFRKIPALNENDESNFTYGINGFSTEYYKNMRERLDKAEWEAKYMQRPFVREGLLFPVEELRYFNGIIPDEEHRVIAACDPAFGGGDSLSMPICADYGGNQKYIIDWIFSKAAQGVTVPLIVSKIAQHFIMELRIEKNNGGTLLADRIKQEMKERGINHCKISLVAAPYKMSKEDKITGYSDFVKNNFIFLMPKTQPTNENSKEIIYIRGMEYNRALEEMVMYSPQGKNPNDDAADSITQLAILFEGKRNGEVHAVSNPFRMGEFGYGSY